MYRAKPEFAMDLTEAYEIAAYTPEAERFPPYWAATAEAFRTRWAQTGRLRPGLAYGTGPRHALDLFLPDAQPQGLVVFVHGGFYVGFDRSSWSHLAEGALRQGWAVALPSYDLCPDVRISEITRQVGQAITCAADEVAGPIRLVGHSAGGHLVARMAAPDILPKAVAARLAALMPISPLADLRPLLQTERIAKLRLDAAEAAAESPRLQPVPEVPVTVWVGADERPAFLDQARWLSEAWGCDMEVEAGKHHFDVIEGLADPDSPMVSRLFSR
jgi:arylformamidase